MERAEIANILNRITTKPGLLGGRPAVRGLRFSVSNVLELLASGMTTQQILEEHPALETEDIQACLLYASLKMNNTRIVHAA
jgi:uncharacterized protein (DUF433 family)